MSHPVTWFQIEGKDGEALKTFYQSAFDWKLSAMPGGGGMLAPGGGGIGGHVGTSQSGNPVVAVYVQVDDLAKALEKVERAGGKPAMDPMELPGGMGWISGFVNPAGNWVGLWKAPAKPTAPAAKRGAKKAAKKAPKKAAAKKAAAKKAAPKKAAKKAAKKRR